MTTLIVFAFVGLGIGAVVTWYNHTMYQRSVRGANKNTGTFRKP